jgi:hypothetical protein
MTTTTKKSTHKTPRDAALDAGLAAWFGVTAVEPDIAFLRERMSQAIEAALAMQRASEPPAGALAMIEATTKVMQVANVERVADVDELRRAIAAIGVVDQVDGHDVIRRLSVLEVIDQRIARARS